MPFADFERIRLHYQFTGDSNLPALVFSNSLGADLSMWEPQLALWRLISASCATITAAMESPPHQTDRTQSTTSAATFCV